MIQSHNLKMANLLPSQVVESWVEKFNEGMELCELA